MALRQASVKGGLLGLEVVALGEDCAQVPGVLVEVWVLGCIVNLSISRHGPQEEPSLDASSSQHAPKPEAHRQIGPRVRLHPALAAL